MKRFILALMVATPIVSVAQNGTKDTTYWTKGGTAALDFSNVILKNWAGGGFNSLAGKGLLSLFANWKKADQSWDNALELGYGIVNQFDTDPNDNIDDAAIFKSDDRIDFSSKYGRKAFKNWDYSALLNFRSQFAPGFSTPGDAKLGINKISDFLAPAYIIGAIGLDRKIENKDIPSSFSAFLSPVTTKITIVNDTLLSNAGAYGVDLGETIRSEFGGFVKLAYSRKIYEHKNGKDQVTESMIFDTKIDIFSNYQDRPGNLDINWTTLIGLKFLRYFTFTSGTHLIYDNDIKSQKIYEQDAQGNTISVRAAPGVQFKWVTGLGFTYQF